MPYSLFIVTVPAKIKAAKTADLGVGAPAKSEESQSVTPIALKVRNFIKESANCEWISEEPFLNGKAWWTSFLFTCDQDSSEATVGALCVLGVGQTVAAAARMEAKGKGMILVLPIDIQRIGSRPKVCGHPAGVPYGTSFLSPPSSVNKQPDIVEENTTLTTIESDFDAEEDIEETDESIQMKLQEEDSSGRKFTATFTETIKSRITVDSVIQYVCSASEISFDYVMLIVNAAIIACTGLVTNNTVVIVASMLVSPLMGPIMAATFGAVVESGYLIKRGIIAEVLGLCMCILIGFIGGLCSAPFCGHTWPTNEMASRGVPSALWTGVAIAVPSGFGAALSITGNNTSSLVGVAISASLLPPAVNCGVLLASLALKNSGYIGTDNPAVVNGETTTFDDTSAAISLGVTLVNVMLINICGYIMFRVKGLGSSSNFWSTHVQNTRKYHRALRDPARKDKYEQAFEKAKDEKQDSFREHPMDMIKASIHFNPFAKHSASEVSEPTLETA